MYLFSMLYTYNWCVFYVRCITFQIVDDIAECFGEILIRQIEMKHFYF